MVGNRWLQPRVDPYKRHLPMPQKPLNEYEIAIYNSNVTVSTTFWDWRHRVLTLYLSIVTAVGGIVAWLYQKDPHQAYVGLPLVFASGISLMAYWWELRVRQIIDMSIESCATIEEQWCLDGRVKPRVKPQHPDSIGIPSAYTMLNSSRKRGETRVFSTTIPWLFGVLGVGSLVLACLIFANASIHGGI